MHPIDYSQFVLREDYFDNHSFRHGIKHTYRVMVNVLKIGGLAGLNHEMLLAFCGAFIHDMARKHDGYCTMHGTWAARKKLPEFADAFVKQGVKKEDIKTIALAVSNHSQHEELEKSHRDYLTVALLKDADALDRIRICKNCLNPEYLRFPESHQLIAFAENLYFQTDDIRISSFVEVLDIADRIG
jgi:hypothetical protein